MLLTKENYFSIEANQHYMSNSQYSDFLRCEAMALAKVNGEWVTEPTPDCLAGSMLHSWNEGALERFKEEHPELYKKDGTLLKKYEDINTLIETLEADPFCMKMLEGEKEVILTAELFGVPWKIKIDSYRPGEAIVDLKTTKSIHELTWNSFYQQRVSFIEQFNYPRQMAVYSEVERLAMGRDTWLESYIVAVSKEDPPDKGVFRLTDGDRFYAELNEIKLNLPHIMDVKNGFVEPSACGKCPYCRSKKMVTRIMDYKELMEVD